MVHMNLSILFFHPPPVTFLSLSLSLSLRVDNDEGSTQQPLCYQNGVFRVNCMDCLDRTNVVQSVICKEFIQTAVSITAI